jgi:hypothetical protein
VASGDQPGGDWKVEAQSAAPSSPNVVLGASSCPACVELLVAQGFQYEYPEAGRQDSSGSRCHIRAEVGVVFGLKDPKNYYATVVDMSQKSIEVVRVIEGKESILGRAAIKSKPVEWHTLRVQRNTIISKDFVETFFDGSLALSVEDQTLGVGQVGILVSGQATARFDNFNASHFVFQPSLVGSGGLLGAMPMGARLRRSESRNFTLAFPISVGYSEGASLRRALAVK